MQKRLGLTVTGTRTCVVAGVSCGILSETRVVRQEHEATSQRAEEVHHTSSDAYILNTAQMRSSALLMPLYPSITKTANRDIMIHQAAMREITLRPPRTQRTAPRSNSNGTILPSSIAPSRSSPGEPTPAGRNTVLPPPAASGTASPSTYIAPREAPATSQTLEHGSSGSKSIGTHRTPQGGGTASDLGRRALLSSYNIPSASTPNLPIARFLPHSPVPLIVPVPGPSGPSNVSAIRPLSPAWRPQTRNHGP